MKDSPERLIEQIKGLKQSEGLNLAKYWKDVISIDEAEEIIFNSGMAFEIELDYLDCPVAHLQGCYGIRELKALIVKLYSYKPNNTKGLG